MDLCAVVGPLPLSGVCEVCSERAVCRRKKAAGGKAAAKAVRDDNTKPLTEFGEWARDDVTMDRVGKSVLLYSFLKDGNNRGERVDDKISHVEAGRTIKIFLNAYMYEEKSSKSGGASKGSPVDRSVFPADLDEIPAFSVIEVAVNPANAGGYESGWGLNVARIRPCRFSLYSMMSPLGLHLLPQTHAQSIAGAEAALEISPGLRQVLETKNTGFFGRVATGSYLIEHGDECFRLVGPKATPGDPLSRHLDVMDGGVFAIDISKRDLLCFTNTAEEEEEDGLNRARFLVELASSAGALMCYVVHNEYLLRKDPNRSPFVGVPLVDSNKLLECVPSDLGQPDADGNVRTRFPLPFAVVNMDAPYMDVDLACVDNNSGGEDVAELPCKDLVLASENARVRCAYPLSFGDAVEADFMRILFVPKAGGRGGSSGSGSVGGVARERVDYRLLKKRRVLSVE